MFYKLRRFEDWLDSFITIQIVKKINSIYFPLYRRVQALSIFPSFFRTIYPSDSHTLSSVDKQQVCRVFGKYLSCNIIKSKNEGKSPLRFATKIS